MTDWVKRPSPVWDIRESKARGVRTLVESNQRFSNWYLSLLSQLFGITHEWHMYTLMTHEWPMYTRMAHEWPMYTLNDPCTPWFIIHVFQFQRMTHVHCFCWVLFIPVPITKSWQAYTHIYTPMQIANTRSPMHFNNKTYIRQYISTGLPTHQHTPVHMYTHQHTSTHTLTGIHMY